MSDDEDYSSADDEDYVPSDGEAVSEEENSGDEEDLNLLKDDEDGEECGRGKRKKVKKKVGVLSVRKRSGGIMLEDEPTGRSEENEEEEKAKKQLLEEISKEKEAKKEEQAKKKADDLWSSFLSDVGTRPKAKPATATSPLSTLSKPLTPSQKPVSVPKATGSTEKVRITKVFDFAGESVEVSKEVDSNSKEAKEALKEKQGTGETTASPVPSAKPAGLSPAGLSGLSSGTKRPGGGLGGLLDKLNKKPKMSTLEKSKLDWDSFKQKEGISDELQIHHRGKESFLERKAFLERADYRQFEIEKNLRLGTSKR